MMRAQKRTAAVQAATETDTTPPETGRGTVRRYARKHVVRTPSRDLHREPTKPTPAAEPMKALHHAFREGVQQRLIEAHGEALNLARITGSPFDAEIAARIRHFILDCYRNNPPEHR